MNLTRTITAPLPFEMAEKLDEWVSRHGKTRSWVVRVAVSQFLERELYREERIVAALASADSGVLMTQEEIEKWDLSQPIAGKDT
ncbi:CopG family ribbon-helix-helix protein [Serratia fonticola]|jgi:predicted transcriptional regulator